MAPGHHQQQGFPEEQFGVKAGVLHRQCHDREIQATLDQQGDQGRLKILTDINLQVGIARPAAVDQ